MADESKPEVILRESPVDFDTAVAYALHPEMRRLIILYVAGILILPFGLGLFLDPGPGAMAMRVVIRLIGLGLAVAGATLLFGGLIGAAFKLVTDANRLAMSE